MLSDKKVHESERVVAALIEAIAQGWYPVGSRLPSEPALAEHFGVSRAVVREAIARLRQEGILRSRQGAGTYVTAVPERERFRLQHYPVGVAGQALAEVFELRLVLEAGAAAIAAQRRTQEDLQRLDKIVAAMAERLQTVRSAEQLDDAFHIAVAAATHNPLIERFQRYMADRIAASRALTWSEEGMRRGWAQQAHEEHLAIVAAIRAGDAAAAQVASAQHLLRAAERMGVRAWMAPSFPQSGK